MVYSRSKYDTTSSFLNLIANILGVNPSISGECMEVPAATNNGTIL